MSDFLKKEADSESFSSIGLLLPDFYVTRSHPIIYIIFIPINRHVIRKFTIIRDLTLRKIVNF